MNPITENSRATFERPEKARNFVPGQVVVRFAAAAVAPAIAARRGMSAGEAAKQLPDALTEPLSYLRRSRGLRTVTPVFAPPQARAAAARWHQPAQVDRVSTMTSVANAPPDARSGIAILSLPEKEITAATLSKLGSSPAIEFAERLPARWLAAAPDPKRNLQWALPATRYFQSVRSSASEIKVGIIDTGIDTKHPDLPSPVLYRNGDFRKADVVGHGTHVAGVIAAKTNNKIGITGIADCKLAIWKVFPDDPDDPYLDSLSYLRALGEIVDEGVSVVNLSIGGGGFSQAEADLFANAFDAGILVVAAMGNDYENGNPTSWPAAYDNVLAVGSVMENRERSAFSNTGPHIGLSAPGSNILSTLPTASSAQRQETNYAAWSGTSMATPHVAAAAALIRAKRPNWDPRRVIERLRKSAAPVPAMGSRRWTQEHGAGLLDFKAALS